MTRRPAPIGWQIARHVPEAEQPLFICDDCDHQFDRTGAATDRPAGLGVAVIRCPRCDAGDLTMYRETRH